GIDVIDGELVGLDSAGHIVASGPNMVGTQLKFVHSSKPGEWFVKFENFQQRVRHWIGPIDPLPTYRITWTEPGADPGGDPAGTAVTPTNLCPNPPVIDSTDPLSTSWSGAEAEVLLFTGERYDFDTGAVLATGTDADGWINIACALTARSKMILYRHKPTTQVGTEYFTTPEQRETLLRMFRADYWGNGVPHTVQGETLVWQDSYSWMTGDGPQFFSGGRGSLEGIWTKNGVLCLDTPRRFAEDPGLATLEQPEEYVGGIWDDIANSGPDGSVPPPCTGVIDYDDGDGVQQLDLDDWDSLSNIAHMRSWNPLGE
ncbi:MAG: ADYC domain-containing protein, partial [Myxococcota bacterium]